MKSLNRLKSENRCLFLLKAYKPDATGADVYTAYFIERRLRRLMTQRCNEPMDDEVYQRRKGILVEKLKNLFGGELPEGLFINTDPRGYSIKFEDNISETHPATCLQRDFGGYHILCYAD